MPDTGLLLDFALLAALSGGAVYLAMNLGVRRTMRRLGEARHNETRFRDLTSLSADWFWETDAEYRTTWISGGPTVATFFGDTATYGRRIWEIPGIEVDARALEALRERLGAQQPFFDLEMARSDKRGARQIHIISGQSRLGEGGAFLGYRGVGRDVTEQRRAEKELSQAKERLELALGGGNLAEWDYDLASHQVYLGGGWAAFLGREHAVSVTRDTDLLELVHREDRPAVVASMTRALKGKDNATYTADYRVQTESGGWRWLRAAGQVTKRDANRRVLRMSGTVADIDDQRRAEEALRETEQRYRLLVELAPDAVIVHSGGIIEYANPAAARLLGATSPKRLAGLVLEEFARPDGRERMRERLRYLEAGPGWVGFEQRRMVTLDGRDIVVDGAGVSFLERGRLVIQSVFRDITDQARSREALAEREQRFRDVAEASGEFVWEVDSQWRFIYLSERVEAVLGFTRADLLGRQPREFMPLGEERAVEAWLATHAADGAAWRGLEHRSVTKSGAAIWLSVSAVPVRDAAGALAGYRGTAADITARKQAEARIEYLATRDVLTGLPNRMLMGDRVGQAILAAARGRSQLALLCIDLDRVKLVNDSLGHPAGDALLRAVAERLGNTLRREDTLARLGGDEFVLLWNGLKSAEDAATLAQRVHSILQRPFSVEGRTLNVGATIGVAIYPGDGRDFAELLRNADAAMYDAKESGRGTFRFFSPALHQRSAARLRLENELRSALTRSELILNWHPVLQGKVLHGRGRVVGAEALVRWRHPERGLLMPDEFVPLAEECGLIRSVGEWTLDRALSQIGAWQRSLPGEPWFALNVSAAELAQGDAYFERLRSALRENGVDGSRIELEITERVIMSHLAGNFETLRRIGGLGVRFAVDDFGTGYSSLAYLRLLPVDKLKIDKSFLRAIDSQPADEAIVRAIAALAKTLNIDIAGEGVETEAQLDRLLALGCAEWQGHLFSPPLEATELEALLISGAGRTAATKSS
jgi:diguanylate cyclase (GGDEF)-like protein/PAS domain S-box-containing protein